MLQADTAGGMAVRACVVCPQKPAWPWQVIARGLDAAGFDPIFGHHDPAGFDLCVTWNDFGIRGKTGRAFRDAGVPHLVIENGPRVAGDSLLIQRGGHNGSRYLREAGETDRFSMWGREIEPWRGENGFALILGQRGGKYSELAMPREWPREAAHALSDLGYANMVYRPHPERAALAVKLPRGLSQQDPAKPLREALRGAAACVTFSSMGIVEALLQGVPSAFCAPRHIAEEIAAPSIFGLVTLGEPDRRAFFQKLAWNIWEYREVENGLAFHAYL